MKRLSWLALAIVLTACSEVAKTENQLRARDAAMEAVTAKMIVTREDAVPGHSEYVMLGEVRGHCEDNPEADDVVLGDDLEEAAYRKYGAQVDAILDASAFYNNDDYSPEFEPGKAEGHFECQGTAVHFSDGKQP